MHIKKHFDMKNSRINLNKIYSRFIDGMQTVRSTTKALCLRDRIILTDLHRKTEDHCVNLHWWQMPYGEMNVGDFISEVAVAWMKKSHGIVSDASRNGNTRHLYAIGSIINAGLQNATVWGSGLLQDKKFWWRTIRRLDIRCVRGPLTRDVLRRNGYCCPAVYGDPGILLPMIYTPAESEEKMDYIIVPHHSHHYTGSNVLSPITGDYETFIDKLVSTRLVISSSLHGIILAESYGIPAILLRFEGMNLFKYQDWYYSTGRTEFPIADTVEQALQLEPAAIPDLDDMRNRIMNTFPQDLWK